MKTIDYRLQKEIQHLKEGNKEWFKNYVRQVLESGKPYYAKADYLGLSIIEIQNKIDYLTEDIQELAALKKSLLQAKALAQEAIASVLEEYGVDRLDGTAISSITIVPSKITSKENFKILNENALIALGYYKAVIDEESVKEAMLTQASMDEIAPYVEIGLLKETVPARIKVNTKRQGQNNHQAMELLTLVEAAA